MSEKRQVLYDLRTSYSGPFVVEEFYAEVDKWIKENNYEKEPKKKTEIITKDGKRIMYLVEIFNHLDELSHGVIVLKASFDNVKEAAIKRSKRKFIVNSGDALIEINGFIDSHLHGSIYHVKPMFAAIRILLDKYIWSFKDKFDGIVNNDGRKLFKHIQAFFNVQKFKYE
jgi:hypothetical protein